MRSVTHALQGRLSTRYPGATLSWTGNAALNYNVRAATTDDATRAERRIVPLTLVLLLLVFGTIVAASVPLVVAGLAIMMSLGLAVLLAYAHWPLSIVLRNTVSMLGLGAGIDYALLVVSRFREALAAGETFTEAAERALTHAGHTVLLSATAVVISFAAMLIIPAAELRSIATGGLLVVGVSSLLATTLLPGLLAWLGPRINALRIPLPWQMARHCIPNRIPGGGRGACGRRRIRGRCSRSAASRWWRLACRRHGSAPTCRAGIGCRATPNRPRRWNRSARWARAG